MFELKLTDGLSTIIKNYVEAAAVIVAGGWALWRWEFEERLRRHRDFPALDGEIKSAEAALRPGASVMTVYAVWHNRGKLPVELECDECFLNVYKLNAATPNGPIDLSNREDDENVTLLYSTRPLSQFLRFVLEPSTDTTIQQCFVLPDDSAFLFHHAICMKARQKAYPYLTSELWCERKFVVPRKACISTASAVTDESTAGY